LKKHAPIRCPVDHVDLLLQREFYGIQVDVCERHQAFWLDAGEYNHILHIYGGLRQGDGVADPERIGAFDIVEGVAGVGDAIDIVLGLIELVFSL
jgi:hypothetical protein